MIHLYTKYLICVGYSKMLSCILTWALLWLLKHMSWPITVTWWEFNYVFTEKLNYLDCKIKSTFGKKKPLQCDISPSGTVQWLVTLEHVATNMKHGTVDSMFPSVHQKKLVKTCSNELLDFWTLFIYITSYNTVESGSVPHRRRADPVPETLSSFSNTRKWESSET